jgi:hypothetical protein
MFYDQAKPCCLEQRGGLFLLHLMRERAQRMYKELRLCALQNAAGVLLVTKFKCHNT